MIKLALIFLIVFQFVFSAALAQKLSQQQIKQYKTQITKLQAGLDRLRNRLKSAKSKKLRTDILDKIKAEQVRLAQIKKKLYPKPAKLNELKGVLVKPQTFEVVPESYLSEEAGTTSKILTQTKKERSFEVGFAAGMFSSTTGIMGEIRVPSRIILGPAIVGLRVSAGYLQTAATDRRYLPINFDAVFNFPPGWFTGVNNYIGAGLNYVAYTTGRTQGTFGGQLFYGVESDGFGGIVFGELGYGILRTGFAPSNRGVTALFGFRQRLGF